MDSVRKLLDRPDCKKEFWIFDTGNIMAYLSLFYIEKSESTRQILFKGIGTAAVCIH